MFDLHIIGYEVEGVITIKWFAKILILPVALCLRRFYYWEIKYYRHEKVFTITFNFVKVVSIFLNIYNLPIGE